MNALRRFIIRHPRIVFGYVVVAVAISLYIFGALVGPAALAAFAL